MQLNKNFRNIRKFMARKSPEIAIAFGIAGFIVTVVEAVRKTPKAVKMLEEKKRQIAEEEELEGEEIILTKAEVVSTTWKCYVPATIIGAMSIVSILWARSRYAKRIAGLSTALAVTASDFNQYKAKVREVLGSKKDDEVRYLQNEDKLKKAELPKPGQFSGDAKQWCFSAFGGHYFRSSMQELEEFRKELNERFRGTVVDGGVVDGVEEWIPFTDFEERFPELPVSEAGQILGWNRDDGEIIFKYDSHIMSNGETALVVSFDTSTEEYSGIKKRYPVNRYY